LLRPSLTETGLATAPAIAFVGSAAGTLFIVDLDTRFIVLATDGTGTVQLTVGGISDGGLLHPSPRGAYVRATPDTVDSPSGLRL
jgi:hypothetical protein